MTSKNVITSDRGGLVANPANRRKQMWNDAAIFALVAFALIAPIKHTTPEGAVDWHPPMSFGDAVIWALAGLALLGLANLICTRRK